MVAYGGEPTDAELRVLLAPEGRAVSLDVAEDVDGGLTGRPVGYPAWLLGAALALAAGGSAGVVARALAGPVGAAVGVAVLHLDAAFLMVGAAAVGRWNRQIVGQGPFFYADAAGRRLELPRDEVTVAGADIVAFVEVRAWHTVEGTGEASHERLVELSVLARGPAGGVRRYPVAAAMRGGGVARAGERLADLFGVELRRVR